MLKMHRVLKASIYDAGDLVSKRRKLAHTALAVWRASRSLYNVFFEPLIPCKFDIQFIMKFNEYLCTLF